MLIDLAERLERRRRGERRRTRPIGRPASDDHRREGDEAASVRSSRLERVRRLHAQVAPRPRPAKRPPIMTFRYRSRMTSIPTVSAALRMLADGPGAQAPARAEQPDLDPDHQDDDATSRSGPGSGTSRRASPRPGRFVELGGRLEGVKSPRSPATASRSAGVQVAGHAERRDVDDRAADDLVCPQRDREPGMEVRDRDRHEEPRRRTRSAAGA